MKLNVQAFLSTLPVALEGWLGVIIVIAIVVVIMYVLMALSKGKKQ